MKLTKELAREKFRKSCNLQDINKIEVTDPNYDYKWVDATTDREGLGRVYRYIEKGWEVVYSKDKPIDDRSTSANQDGKSKDLRESPVTHTTRSGHTMVLMRCSKKQREINEAAKHKDRLAKFRAQQKLIKKSATGLTVQGEDVNLTKLSEDN